VKIVAPSFDQVAEDRKYAGFSCRKWTRLTELVVLKIR